MNSRDGIYLKKTQTVHFKAQTGNSYLIWSEKSINLSGGISKSLFAVPHVERFYWILLNLE